MLEAQIQSAGILEQDGHGIKIVRLSNGNILKIFRIKSLISIARIYSYARQFCNRTSTLKSLNVPTVTILSPDWNHKSAVEYQPLEI